MSPETAAELVERLTREGLESLRDDVAHGRRGTGLKSLDERGAMSEIVRDQYTGRYPLELIQNANDAEASEGSTGGQVKFVVTDTALLVADQGAGFGIDQVNAICGLARSSKDPRKNVGYKGLGFKSVREITDRPQIISVGVRFGFDAERLRREVEAIAGPLPEGQRLPDYAFPFSVSDEDLGDDHLAVEVLVAEGFRTVLRLPFREPGIHDRVAEHISKVVTSRMLLFLDATESLEIVGTFKDSTAQAARQLKNDHEFLVLQDAGETMEYLIFRRHFEIPDRRLVEGLGRAWQDVTSVRAVAAVPLGSDDNPRGGAPEPIYVYFPTEEETGFSIALHADFQMDLDRRRISTSMHAGEYNEWLRGELVRFVSYDVVPWLAERYPGVSVLDALASRKPATGHGIVLRKEVLQGLSGADLVPCRDCLHAPIDAKLLPSSVPDLSLLHSWLPNERPYVLPAAQETPEIRSMLSNEFAVREVSSGTLLAELEPPANEMEVERFYGFLLEWSRRDARFIDNLRSARCVRLRGGRWATPSEPAFLPRQRNEADFPAELNIPIVEVPDVEGIDDLLERAGVKQLDWRIVVTDFLKPLLTDDDQIPPATRESALAALRTYYDTRRGESGDISIREAVQTVLLPARRLAATDDLPALVAATDLYFGTNWLPGSRLETIYGPFGRLGFLDVPLPSDPDEVSATRAFYAWLGVADRPRVRESRDPRTTPASWRASTEYVSAANDPEKHTDSQILIDPQVDRIHDLVRISDRTRLVALWYEIAAHWSRYTGEIERAIWRCRAGAHRGERNRTLTSSTAFALRDTSCFPVLRDGQPELARSREVWRPASNTPAKVRRLMPITDPGTGHIPAALADWLGFVDGARANSENWIGLLVDLAKTTANDDMNDADVEASLWLMRQLNRGWTSQDGLRDSESIPLLARQAGGRKLIHRPYLVNDPLLAEAWSDVVPIFDGGRDLDSLTSGLELDLLDDQVKVTPVAGEFDVDASERVRARLAGTCPAILALAAQRFPSRVDEIAALLNGLDVFCTAELSLEYRFEDFQPRLLPDAQVYFSPDAKVYLRIEDSEPDWATLGLRLAGYLDVDLGDAAATLLITADPAIDPAITRRYLTAHRIGEADLQRATDTLVGARLPESGPGDEAAIEQRPEDEAPIDGQSRTGRSETLDAGADSHDALIEAYREGMSGPDPSVPRHVGSGETNLRAHSASGHVGVQESRSDAGPEGGRPAGNGPSSTSVGFASRDGELRTASTPPRDDSRFYSYVVAAGSREARMAARAESEAMKIGVDGVDLVVDFEAAAGRVAIPQPHNTKGFDIVSESPDGDERRVIEVKATANAWPQRGIPISSSQMEKNRELGQDFWLYVVEYASSPDRAQVIPIRDPGSAVDYFVFDSGWRNLANQDPI